MLGRVGISPEGRLTGWATDKRASKRPKVIVVHLDGRWVASLHASQWSHEAEAVDPGATFSGFSYPMTDCCADNRLHLVDTGQRGGSSVPGSPVLWERPDTQYPADQVFTLASLQEAARTPSVTRTTISAPLKGGSAVVFDRRSFKRFESGRQTQWAGNDPVIGRVMGHRGYRPWPAFLAVLKDAYIDTAHGGVYLADGRLWQGSKYLANSTAEAWCRAAIAQTAPLKVPPAQRCLVFCNSVRNTYFHWHLDCLAGLVMARSMLGADFVALAPQLNAWQRASLDLLGEAPVEWEGLCHPETAIAPAHIDGRGSYPDRWVGAMFDRIKSRALKGRSPQRRRRLFVSREDATHRVLANEDELWLALKAKGFYRFTPGTASYADQITAFAEAEIVVASHGSALTNIGFCRKRTQIVEILPRDYVNGCFRYLAVARKLKHAWFVTPHVEPFQVEVADFMGHCNRWGLF